MVYSAHDFRSNKIGSAWDAGSTRIAYPLKYLVITGDLTNGFDFYGSFDTTSEADRWASSNLKKSIVYKIYPLKHVRIKDDF